MTSALFNFRYNIEDRVVVIGKDSDVFPGTWKVMEQIARSNGPAYKCMGGVGTGLLMGQTRIFMQEQINLIGSASDPVVGCICATSHLVSAGCTCGEFEREMARKAASDGSI